MAQIEQEKGLDGSSRHSRHGHGMKTLMRRVALLQNLSIENGMNKTFVVAALFCQKDVPNLGVERIFVRVFKSETD